MWFKLEKMQMRFSRMERLFFIISSRESLERKIEGVKLLVCDDVKLNEMHGGLILLHYACALNELDICELLLQHGADCYAYLVYFKSYQHYCLYGANGTFEFDVTVLLQHQFAGAIDSYYVRPLYLRVALVDLFTHSQNYALVVVNMCDSAKPSSSALP
ncbi:ankyrin repeat protein [Trichuris suis]|nr:ankyrin repeat protein [Trichuris suis]